MSGQIDIKQALKKAYRKQKPTRSEIDVLKRELTRMLDEANKRESEEYHKGLLKDFLKKSAYSDYFINPKDTEDLVIHNGKSSKSTVGVIIETKRPDNKAEMPTVDNLNKKGMQELLLYFLRERVTNKNFEIKHLIVTDLYKWFIFDAIEFERIAEKEGLRKHFDDFEKGRLIFGKTEHFYSEIAARVLEEVKSKIKFVHIDINNYEGHLRKQTQAGDRKLIELQKILSPTHLLKLPFANDSNTLNREFYSELLHIIGLEEFKEKGKKLIRRRGPKSRDEDSLIESAITQITSLDKLSRIEDLERFGGNKDEQLFNVGLELVITWINRLLFLKLLESQIVSYHDSKDYLFLNKEKVPEYDDLNTLFFQVLAVEKKSRSKAIQDKFPNVPYLNSSLFEPTELEHQTIFISNLPDGTSLGVYKKTVLNNDKDKRELNTLEYLFKFLDAYDFSSEGKEDITEENRPLINASVLGLIFEKINGYKDGSFFTPGFVTMYMCRETIRRTLLEKFKEQTDFDSDTYIDLVNFIKDSYKKSDLDKYNEIINSLRICDPAVGSGHFLVSALNEIVAIKSELEILRDESGKALRDYLIDVENDELMVLDNNGEFFKYEPKNIESQRIQKTLFHEKQTIIENCLFGVDVNHNSVKICQLRLWIELLKNSYYKEDGELETLPNIDINIKCGNSLISRYPIDADLGRALVGSNWDIGTYRLAVMSYRSAENKEQKNEAQKLISRIKSDFHTGITENEPIVKKRKRIAKELSDLTSQERLFGQDAFRKDKKVIKRIEELAKAIATLDAEIEEIKSGAIYRDAFEWRFEFPEVLDERTGDFAGFDIIIANPPYVYNRDLSPEQRKVLSEKFGSADDLYVYFVYESIKHVKPAGTLSFITPNTYFTLSTRSEFRRFLLNHKELSFTYSGFCFADAYVETMIMSLTKQQARKSDPVKFIKEPNDYTSYDILYSDASVFLNNIYYRFFWPTKLNLRINARINRPLRKLSLQFEDVLNGRSTDAQEISGYLNSLKADDLTLLGIISSGEQGLVTGNNSKYIARISKSKPFDEEVEKAFLAKLNSNNEIKYEDFLKNRDHYYGLAEQIKEKKKEPQYFGRSSLYKIVPPLEIEHYSELSTREKQNGGGKSLWVYYNRGNPEGRKWSVPYTECINWSKTFVKELKEGTVTNSRWQGEHYYDTTGFAWVDYFTDEIKAFFVEEGVYSKNIVKMNSISELAGNKYIVGCLNSTFITYYVKQFITSTHTLQINDGRLIPIRIPDKDSLNSIENVVDQILAISEDVHYLESPKKRAQVKALEREIDEMVYRLYRLSDEEIAIVEGRSKAD